MAARLRAGPPQIALSEVRYGPDGEMDYPRRRRQAGEEAFPGYLEQARAILAARPARLDQGPTGLPPEFEALRWFRYPRHACGASPPLGRAWLTTGRRRIHHLCRPGFRMA